MHRVLPMFRRGATFAVLSLLLTMPAMGAGKTLRIYSDKPITDQIHDVNGGEWTWGAGQDALITELYIGPLGYSCVYGSSFSAIRVEGTLERAAPGQIYMLPGIHCRDRPSV